MLQFKIFGVCYKFSFGNCFFVHISSMSSHGAKTEYGVCAFNGDFYTSMWFCFFVLKKDTWKKD